MNNNAAKKLGRRAAGSWGRPRKTWAKRMSAKAVRRAGQAAANA